MPVKVILLDNYEQLDYLGSNDILKKLWQGLGLGPGFIPISPLSLISKSCTHISWINIMIRIKKVIRTDQ